MPAAFIIAQMTIHDRAAFAAYSTSAGESVIKYGGDFLVVGQGRREMLEGEGDMQYVAAARFPTYEAALRWYRSPEYAPLIKARQKAAIGRVMIIEGID
jgi:uncharacterized protein (DUF1330 family)